MRRVLSSVSQLTITPKVESRTELQAVASDRFEKTLLRRITSAQPFNCRFYSTSSREIPLVLVNNFADGERDHNGGSQILLDLDR